MWNRVSVTVEVSGVGVCVLDETMHNAEMLYTNNPSDAYC